MARTGKDRIRLTGLAGLGRYQRSWLRGDLLAGVTVAAYLVPQVMAYAAVAGLRPEAGLWAAVPALVIYAVIGSSRSLSLGPEATTALMTAAAIGPLAAGNPARYAAMASALALLTGLMAVLASGARLGFIADLPAGRSLSGHGQADRSGAIGAENLFPTLPTAVAAYQQWATSHHLRPDQGPDGFRQSALAMEKKAAMTLNDRINARREARVRTSGEKARA